MANPDFTGPVSRFRCETCKHWDRVPGLTKGLCKINTHLITPTVAPTPTHRLYTTDLMVCSNWDETER